MKYGCEACDSEASDTAEAGPRMYFLLPRSSLRLSECVSVRLSAFRQQNGQRDGARKRESQRQYATVCNTREGKQSRDNCFDDDDNDVDDDANDANDDDDANDGEERSRLCPLSPLARPLSVSRARLRFFFSFFISVKIKISICSIIFIMYTYLYSIFLVLMIFVYLLIFSQCFLY